MITLKARAEISGAALDALEQDTIDTLRVAVGNIARGAHNEWIRRAQSKLNTSRDTYIRGLQQSDSFSVSPTAQGDVYQVQLVGQMPNEFEFGKKSFDMKTVRPGWLGGAKARTAKDGSKYVIIPFRHSTSSTTNINYTGKAAAVNNPDLKTQLRAAVKEYGLDRMQRLASGRVQEGAVAKIPNRAPVHPYLQGLVRIQKGLDSQTSTGKQRGSSSLMTFRIMSTKSPASSWIHPGIKAANILPEIEAWVNSQMDKILGDFL